MPASTTRRPRAAKAVLPPQSTTIGPTWTPRTGLGPSPISKVSPFVASSGIRVTLVARRALGNAGEEREFEWPTDLRIPEQGDSIHLAKDWGGFVQSVDFWPLERRVYIFLR